LKQKKNKIKKRGEIDKFKTKTCKEEANMHHDIAGGLQSTFQKEQRLPLSLI